MVRALVRAIKSLKLKFVNNTNSRAATRISNEGLKYNPSAIHSYNGSITDKTEDQFDVMIVDEASMIDIDLMNNYLFQLKRHQ